MHPELMHYLLENNMLQDGDLSSNHPSELGKFIFSRNIDFIARNHRRHLYWDHDFNKNHSEPTKYNNGTTLIELCRYCMFNLKTFRN